MLITFSNVYKPIKVSDETTHEVDSFKDFDFNSIKEMKTLRLIGGFLEDLSFLKELSNLEDLILSSCQITEKDIKTIESLIHLKRLNLSGVTLEDDKYISNIDYSCLSELEILNLSNMSRASIKDFKNLRNLKGLYLIDIKELDVSDETIKLPSLVNLFISTKVLKDVKFLKDSFPVIRELTIIVQELQDFELEDLDSIYIDSLRSLSLVVYNQNFSITVVGDNNE